MGESKEASLEGEGERARERVRGGIGWGDVPGRKGRERVTAA